MKQRENAPFVYFMLLIYMLRFVQLGGFNFMHIWFSRSKNYAFGIFRTNRKHREAFLYLAGESETDSQKWMANIRCLLKPPMFFRKCINFGLASLILVIEPNVSVGFSSFSETLFLYGCVLS